VVTDPANTSAAFPAYRDRKYFPELDGIRAVCILGVVSAHVADNAAWHWLSGGLGVNVFFVLSGYLITMLALREERARGQLSLSAFYVRRTLRIFPLYFLAVAVYCGLLFLTNWGRPLRANFVDDLPYYLTYLQEVPYAFEVIANGRPSPFAHSWSLGIEEKYYLVWPVLAFGLWAWRPARRLWGTLVLLVLFAATQSVGRLHPAIAAWRPEILLYPYSHILWGCLLAILLENERWFARLRWLGTPLGTALSLAAFVAAQLAYAPLSDSIREVVILHAVATTALLTSVLTGGGWLTRLLQTRPAVFVGRVSYGMYLFHALGISAAQKVIRPGSGSIEWSLLTFALAVLVTVLMAWVLAVLVERPCLRFGRRWSEAILRRPSEVAMPVAAGEVVAVRPAEARPRRWFRVPGRAR
jgi:peptidoglycan/LPS O-acetylase OafA/YrhL